MAIGICDWGIGGVGLLKLLQQKSAIDAVYLSDTGFTPYGKVPKNDLQARLDRVFSYFHELGIEHIAVGCNAASTVIDDSDKIIGVISHGVSVVKKNNLKKVGIVGGRRTIESEIYKKQLEKEGVEVLQSIAQPLSARIEAGDVDSLGLEKDIEEIFSPLLGTDHILLACTHYPLIADKIIKFTGPINLLDPAEEMCNWILNNWDLGHGEQNVTWLTTGDTGQMALSLNQLYHFEQSKIEVKKIEL